MKGTICKVGNFLKNEKIDIELDIDGHLTTYLSFKRDRVIMIPMYQREVRWNEQQVNELLKDIMIEEKFLGNIFLSDLGNDYELIDGQQRLTVLYIILKVLKEKYYDVSNLFRDFELVNIRNDSFLKFYETTSFKTVEDPFNQKERYYKIHSFVDLFFNELSDREVNIFCKNIFNSQINVILLEHAEQQKAIDGFIDINVKGVKLDSEDILKGYFFRLANNNKIIKEKWIKLKVNYFKLKKYGNKLELTELFYNIMFCILRNDPRGIGIEKANINKKFLLENKVEIVDREKTYTYEKGAHIMELIDNYSIVEMILNRTIEFVELNLMFYKNNISKDSEKFRKCFGLENSDSSVREVYFKMVQTLIRNDISVYRFLATYCYINSVNGYITKKEYCERMIYHCYFYSFIFDALATRKGVYSIAKEIGGTSTFCSDLVELSYSILKNNPEPRLSFTQKMCIQTKEDTKKNINGKFTVLHFATLFECFKFEKHKKELIFNNSKFNDIYSLTNEHFLINDGGSYKVGDSTMQYTPEQKKVKDYFINLIPISEKENHAMDNLSIEGKINYLSQKELENVSFWEDEACMYTETYFNILKEEAGKREYSVEKIVKDIDLILTIIYEIFIKEINV